MKPLFFLRPHFLRASMAGAIALLSPTAVRAAWMNDQEAAVIIGRQTVPSASSLFRPNDVAVSAAGKVYVVDLSYHRILRYGSVAALGNGQAAEAVFGQPNFQAATPGVSQTSMNGPSSVTIDSSGNLWVADTENSRVLRWANADTAATGAAAVQVLGQPDFATSTISGTTSATLNRPGGLAVDASGKPVGRGLL